MQCNLRAGEGLFCFKVAYDEGARASLDDVYVGSPEPRPAPEHYGARRQSAERVENLAGAGLIHGAAATQTRGAPLRGS